MNNIILVQSTYEVVCFYSENLAFTGTKLLEWLVIVLPSFGT